MISNLHKSFPYFFFFHLIKFDENQPTLLYYTFACTKFDQVW